MNAATFTNLLRQLNDDAWQSVASGQALLLVDDVSLAIGPAGAANAIISADQTDAIQLKKNSIEQAADILHNYYLTHPLTRAGFNRQVEQLFDKHGAAAFAALAGQLPPYTLFVEGGEVIAESAASPRHRYGVYCELPRRLTDEALPVHLNKWLQRGEAYDDYLGMNVCRYNC
ncbi:MAG: hypothetical protein PVG66_14035 [Chromatiales bacterium]|jgi:hypothetical protein